MKTSRVPRTGQDPDDAWDHLVRVRTLLVIGLVLPAPACLVGPDFVKPKAPLNASWSEGRDPRLATTAAADVAWWKAFADPTLDELIELAYHQSLSLQVAGLRILEARALLGIAVGQQYPTNPGPIARSDVVKPSEHAANSANINHHYGEYQVGFDAIWELDFWGKLRRGVRAASASYLATVADYDDALVTLSAEVARTYVVIRTFEVLVDLAHQNVQVQEEGQQIAESRFRNGATSELDVVQATNLLESTRATIPVLEIGQRQAQNALSTLLGRPTGYVRSLLAAPRGIPAPPARVAVSVPAEMLRRRPDIRAAELRAVAQCERIGIAKAELYPSFVLFGSISTQTTSGVGRSILNAPSSFTSLFGPGSLAYNAGGSLFWPILAYRQLLNNVRAEDARFQQSLVAYVNTVLQAAQEVEDGMIGFLRQQDAAKFEQNAVTAAESSVRLALVQYREGAVDFQRVLDSQRALLDSQNRLATTRSSAVTDLIALYKALGGGWELRQGDPVVPEPTRREMQDRTSWDGYLSKPPGPESHTTGDTSGSPPGQN
jgi:NodT family efflux transporter outer membrane factor (OMF) lipoprotein